MTTEKTALQRIADEARNLMETRERPDGSKFWARKDGAPGWMETLCMDAHGDMSPDDWRYAFIVDALDALAENEDADEISMEADVYTHELTRWLGSRADRYSFCDEAREDYDLAADLGMIERIQCGQVREKEEVLSYVRQSLEGRLEETGAGDEEGDDA